MLGIAIAVALALSLWFLQGQRSGIRRNGKRLPRPPGTLLFAGNGLWFLQPRHKLLEWFAQVQPEVGFDTYEIAIPSLPAAILVNDPKNVEHVLKNNELFIKGNFFRSRSWDLFGNGIINADGELWRIQRKAGLRFFSNANLKTFINDIVPPLLADTKRDLDDASRNGAVVDLQDVLLELTTRLMGKMAYDMDMHGSLPFSKAFDFASGETTSRFTNPFWRIKELFFGRSLRKAIAEVHRYGRTVVTEAVEKRSSKPTEKHSPLQSNLIDSLLDHLPSEDLVADAAMNFLSAGRDTTAQSMTWTFYNLMRHPPIIPLLREELTTLLPASSLSTSSPHSTSTSPSSAFSSSSLPPLPLTYDTIQPAHLPYTLALFSETLRLYPPVPFELKEATAPTTFPDGTFLPANAVVLWVPWAMGRSTRIWGDDALEFRPGRWLDYGEPVGEPMGAPDGRGDTEGVGGAEVLEASEAGGETEGLGESGVRSESGSKNRGKATLLTKSAYENPVFNAGPRNCLGKKMAELLAT
ncbi:hypothetical protein MMC30_008927, partial [Trapelia coarctata]|nr:hypothetical protein [Trapelia coarctata]